MLAAQLHATEVRNRLRNPPNAVKDHGIDLQRRVLPFVPVESPKDADVFGPVIKAKFQPPVTAEDMAFGPIVHAEPPPPKAPSVKHIVGVVSRFYNVSVMDINSARRTAGVTFARQVAMYLCKTLTLNSLPSIGQKIGGRDHTTVLHAVRKIEGIIGIDQGLADQVEILKREIMGVACVQQSNGAQHDPNQS